MDCFLGQLVRSLAGRDKGKYYLVIGLGQKRVLVADGKYRPIKNPKKKNIAHLQVCKLGSNKVMDGLVKGRLTDTLLYQELQNLLQKKETKRKEVR